MSEEQAAEPTGTEVEDDLKRDSANFSECTRVHKLAAQGCTPELISDKTRLKLDLVNRIIEAKAHAPGHAKPAEKGVESVQPGTQTIAEAVKADQDAKDAKEASDKTKSDTKED